MSIQPRVVTPETRVMVIMKGTHHIFTIGDANSITAWANTLSDLTGYTTAFIVETLTVGLATNYGVRLPTSAGDLCPIRFSITLESSRKATK